MLVAIYFYINIAINFIKCFLILFRFIFLMLKYFPEIWCIRCLSLWNKVLMFDLIWIFFKICLTSSSTILVLDISNLLIMSCKIPNSVNFSDTNCMKCQKRGDYAKAFLTDLFKISSLILSALGSPYSVQALEVQLSIKVNI